MRKKIYVLHEKCVGCKICEYVCSLKNSGKTSEKFSRIHVTSPIEPEISYPIVCDQCLRPLCMDICPRDAITFKERIGAYVVDKWDCDGCEKCVIHCPIGAIKMNKEKKVAEKCELCEGDPPCVKWCPTEALVFVDEEEIVRMKHKAFAERVKNLIH